MMDVYKLGNNEGKGSIRAVFTPELKTEVKKSISKISSQILLKDLCEELEIDYTTLWDYLNRRNYVPLFVLKKLEELSKNDLRQYINYLEYGAGATKKRVKVAKFCKELASILGAHIADGHLKKRETSWQGRKVPHYELVFREEYKSNMLALAKWLNKVFEINIKPKKEKNHYYIYISNKIIFRYFVNIFGFKSGRKTETVEIPQIFYESPDNIKKAIIKGILMFDGSVSRSTGYIELYSKSKNLIGGTSRLLTSIEIAPDYVSLNPDKFGRYRLIIRKKAKLIKSLELFEPNTEKWLRLKKILERRKK